MRSGHIFLKRAIFFLDAASQHRGMGFRRQRTEHFAYGKWGHRIKKNALHIWPRQQFVIIALANLNLEQVFNQIKQLHKRLR